MARYEPIEESPTVASMLNRVDELANRGRHADVEAVYAKIGHDYLSGNAFHLAGNYFKKAKMFMDAANAFMRCEEYFSAGRCFDIAKEREMAIKAYLMAGTRAEGSNNLSLAHHVYKKAGHIKKAQCIEEKLKAKKVIVEKTRISREKSKILRQQQAHENDPLLYLLNFKKHLAHVR